MNRLIYTFPMRGWIGLLLIVVFWFINWSAEGLRTHLGFFPMWLGYCLVVDSLTYIRTSSSLFSRNKKYFIMLFILSAPSWWIFELFNTVTHNWIYIGREYFSDLEYAMLATLSFSTVMPAVFGTVELIASFKLFSKINLGIIIHKSITVLIIMFIAGITMLFLILSFPKYFYPFVWGTVFLIVEPINVLLKRVSLLDYLRHGNWVPVLNLFAGTLICGVFWEMWNYYSFPKWIYDAPFVNFLHVFEMPLLGFIGYLPFSLELFSLYGLFSTIPGISQPQKYIIFK
ncbi:MAG: hypothetical protein JW995_05295 [Melioribacteraceae bacterium]|nr:hypothetical protein [Melioribacteraceae bacterium]